MPSFDMPPWFAPWYDTLIRELHAHIADPDRTVERASEAMMQVGMPGREVGKWQKQVEERCYTEGSSPTSPLSYPDRWNDLTAEVQEQLRSLRSGQRQVQTEAHGAAIEQWVQPLLMTDKLSGRNALWIWQYLAGTIGLAEENNMRHWVDAEEENLLAFEARYELWDQLGSMPGAIVPQPELAWASLFASHSPIDNPPRKYSFKRWLIGASAIGLALLLGFLITDTKVTYQDAPESFTSNMNVFLGDNVLQYNWDGESIRLNGSVRLELQNTEIVKIEEASLTLAAGQYLMSHSDQWQLAVITGSAMLETDQERFVLLPGEVAWQSAGRWLKKRE